MDKPNREARSARDRILSAIVRDEDLRKQKTREEWRRFIEEDLVAVSLVCILPAMVLGYLADLHMGIIFGFASIYGYAIGKSR